MKKRNIFALGYFCEDIMISSNEKNIYELLKPLLLKNLKTINLLL